MAANLTPEQQEKLKLFAQALQYNGGSASSSKTETVTQPTQTIAYQSSAAAAPVVTTVVANDGGRSKRQAQRDAFTGWDNDPAVRTLQERSWAIYIDTGRWDTAEQKELSKQAQQIREYNNPMYDASKSPWGPSNWIEAEQITPRDTTPNANSAEGALDSVLNVENFGSYAKAGVGLMVLMFVFSMFRR